MKSRSKIINIGGRLIQERAVRIGAAKDLVKPRQKLRVVIVGSGVIGLTTAVMLAEDGYEVHVYYNQPLSRTASFAAAAFWFPVLVGRDPRIPDMAANSLKVFTELAADAESGVSPGRLRIAYTDASKADLSWRAIVDATEVPNADLPSGCVCGFDTSVYKMVMDKYLPYLKRWALSRGVKFHKRFVSKFAELPEDFPIVINATGVWARNILKDYEVVPIRGQIVIVSKTAALENARVSYPYDVILIEGPKPDGEERLDYIVQRDEDYLLGGTQEFGDWGMTIRPELRDQILRNCTKLMPELEGSAVIAERVGLRPGQGCSDSRWNPCPGGGPSFTLTVMVDRV